ncbi:hypothetical protein [Arthrobacter antibioticus]|uniref:hypothetical protein n=1 Tax=Arthrobacter sp. H35-MC1 TaxID=3046203 RepID=UPI0024BA617E|nr:hypothetical protein [Arthrobacter sp. H35-MC1]MDJ0316454.1 hypothetical protein [Arthrobacter sp. H35-MC1]
MQGKSKIIWLGVAVFVAAQRWLDTFRQLLTSRSHGRFMRPATGRSRGDVPGWVLITLMSAVLVAGLLAIAGPALERLFNQAMEQVQP